MIHEAFHPTETFREREQMGVLEEAPRTGEIGFQNDCDHAAERAHLFLGEFMLRMLFEPRVVNLLDLRLLLEPARDLERVLTMALHPQGQRLQSPQRQETVERSGNGADRVLQERYLIPELLVF